MHDDQLLRYSRHILLNEIGIEGQDRLLASHALIIGAGGLGSPVALYLGSAGVGHITVVDHDRSTSPTCSARSPTRWRASASPRRIRRATPSPTSTPTCRSRPCCTAPMPPCSTTLVPQADVVLDCSDNFATRHAINRACVKHRKPLVSGAAIRFDGQITVYDPRTDASPCYACVFPEPTSFEETRCATMGVFAPLVGIIGTLQAAEALKLLCGIGTSLAGRLLMLDGRAMEFTEVRIGRQSSCTVCGAPHAAADSAPGTGHGPCRWRKSRGNSGRSAANKPRWAFRRLPPRPHRARVWRQRYDQACPSRTISAPRSWPRSSCRASSRP